MRTRLVRLLLTDNSLSVQDAHRSESEVHAQPSTTMRELITLQVGESVTTLSRLARRPASRRLPSLDDTASRGSAEIPRQN